MKLFSKWSVRLALGASFVSAMAGISGAQTYSFSEEMERKVASHPHVRRLTDWGSRPEWAADSKRLLFVSREYGDVFELDIASGKSRPMTFHFPHSGMFRALYLQNGDILLTAPRTYDPLATAYGRFFGSELWVMKGDLSGPPVPLGVTNHEGVAVSRTSMQIVWVDSTAPRPAKRPDSEFFANPIDFASMEDQIWIGEIVYEGGVPRVAGKRKLLDCEAAEGVIAEINAARGSRCTMIEPQNLVPPDDSKLTFTMVTRKTRADGQEGVASFVLDLRSGKLTQLNTSPGYFEVEGVFPGGRFSLAEHAGGNHADGATSRVDLWKVALDGSGALSPVTSFNSIDPQLKSNQGVISPDGHWMAFGVSTAAVEKRVPGQGMGLFLMDLEAAGHRR